MRLSLLIMGISFATATGAVQTGPLNNLAFEERAATDACYLKMIRLYHARYLVSQDNASTCIELTYQRPFSVEELSRSTHLIYRERHGAQQAASDELLLSRLTSNYRPVAVGDAYKYCTTDLSGGWLYHNATPVLHIEDPLAASRVMGIWIADIDPNGLPEWNFSSCLGKVF